MKLLLTVFVLVFAIAWLCMMLFLLIVGTVVLLGAAASKRKHVPEPDDGAEPEPEAEAAEQPGLIPKPHRGLEKGDALRWGVAVFTGGRQAAGS